MIIKDIITQDESDWYLNKLSSLFLLKMYRDNEWEFEFWYSGLKGKIQKLKTFLRIFTVVPLSGSLFKRG